MIRSSSALCFLSQCLLLWASCGLFVGCSSSPSGGGPAPRLNVLLILCDDLGWRDLSCYGSEFYETPHIDALASQGMRFTHAYAPSTVCSPSRASILTGRSPASLHLTDWIAGLDYPYEKLSPPEDWMQYLPHETYTLAEAFKAAGYQTASIGKWHLGKQDHYPTTHGFDVKIAGSEAGGPGSYFYPYKNGLWATPDLEAGEEGEYLTDRLTTEALQWLDGVGEQPFFLYLPFFNPHRPTQAKEAYIQRFQNRLKDGYPQQNPINAGMIYSLDENVGRIMAYLEEKGLAENTLVVFTSDNGGNHYADTPQKTSNHPLRAGKGSAYEGGIRVPMVVRWPGVVAPGKVSEVPVSGMDLFPTLAEAVGLSLASEQQAQLEGASLLPLLNQTGPLQRQALYWHYPHYHHGGASPHAVVRRGDYKLIHFFEDGHHEVYHIVEDPGETQNLAQQRPELAEELHALLEAWLDEVDAQLPTANPAYDPDSLGVWGFRTKELW